MKNSLKIFFKYFITTLLASIAGILIAGTIITFCSCSTHKGMVKCPENQEVYYAKRHKKMLKCSRIQKGSKEIWLFNWQIR